MLFIWVLTLAFVGSCSAQARAAGGPDVLLRFIEETYGVGRGAGEGEYTRGMQLAAEPNEWSELRSALKQRTWGDKGGKPLLLTPLIEQRRLAQARGAARVSSKYTLPGLVSYAGYLTVNKKYNSNLWFWYFPVAGRAPGDTPWVTWLQGGPGASSLYGLFTEIGPLSINKDGHPEEMKHSWGKEHSLLFIDNPVGAGFSFTDDPRGYATNQTTIGENLYSALQQFLTLFPELRRAPLTVAGESYAGKHIPSLGVQILRNRDKRPHQPINLYGLAIGNGFIDPVSLLHYSAVVREVGLVDDAGADLMRRFERSTADYINKGEMEHAYRDHNKIFDTFASKSHWKNMYNYVVPHTSLGGPHVEWLARADVRRALHVGDTPYWPINYHVYHRLIPDMLHSAKALLEELLANYRVMLYNGQLDIIVAYHPSVHTYNALSFPGAEEYRAAPRLPWYHDQELAGYYKVGGNLTEVMVLGAGHMVPGERPAQALALLSAFVRGRALRTDTADPTDSEQ